MNNINLKELPNDYKKLYANKIYIDITHEKIKYDDTTINSVIDFFIEHEEYEKCEKLKRYDNK